METNTQESLWKRLQRGQAMSEYWPTIPAAIAVMIAGSIIAQAVGGAFQKTADGLNCGAPAAIQGGSPFAALGPHSVEVAGWVYDPVTDRTTVAYEVTNGGDPAISHWVLGMDADTYADILQVSEVRVNPDGSTTALPNNYSFGVDPTTNVEGLKFDTGYESGGGSGGNGGNGGNGGGNGNGNGRGHAKRLASFSAVLAAETSGETRLISITLDGNHTFGAVSVTAKGGTDVWGGTVHVSSSATSVNCQS